MAVERQSLFVLAAAIMVALAACMAAKEGQSTSLSGRRRSCRVPGKKS